MYIAPVTNCAFTGLRPVRISAKSKTNKAHPFLYNEVLNIVRKEKIGAVFHITKIELPAPTRKAVKELRKHGIKYYTYKK